MLRSIIRAVVRDRLFLVAALLFAAAPYALSPARAANVLDGDEDFTLLATLGFEQAIDGAHAQGTRKNDYAWSMAWFNGKLLVGTGQFEIDPATGQPGAGQIWAYTPGGSDGKSGTWNLAYEAPDLLGAPREFGYRWMTQCSFRGTNYLFVSTLGTLQGNILYTSDGVTFNTVSRIGIPFASVGFRTMICFTEESGKTTLVTTPVGQAGDASTFDSDRSANPIALANDDPAGFSGWHNYSALRMGDPDNNSFFAMHAFNGWLYAGVGNQVTGAQVWRTRGCQTQRVQCVPTWTKLIDRGGGRPSTPAGEVGNRGFSDMISHNGLLYLAVSAPALDGDQIRAELWRMRADNTFEVLIGDPRLNYGTNGNAASTNAALPASLRCGVPLEDIDGVGGANDCPPTTRRGAGYGDIGSAATGYPDGRQFYFWRTFVYNFHPTASPYGDGRLYIGTFQGTGPTGNATFGFDILATTNGTDWSTVTVDGFGFPQQLGMRSIIATPYGLAVGGTHFPIPGLGALEIRGCNVWLGVPLPDSLAPVTTLVPPSPGEGATLNVRNASFAWTGTDTPATGSLPLTYAYRLDPLEPAFSVFGAATTKSYASLPDGSYTFHVIARDNAGNTEAPGAAPGAANRRGFAISAPDLPPSVTINVAPASPNVTGSASFAWSGSDDNTPAASLVYDTWLAPLQADPGTFGAATSRSYSGLADGAYTFHVIAKDGAGNLSADTVSSFSVAIPPGPPQAPAPATVALTAPRVLRVTWTDVTGETFYSVERCQSSGRGCAFVSVAPNVSANTTSLVDTLPGGAPAGAYQYRVQACSATLGCSAWAMTNTVNVP